MRDILKRLALVIWWAGAILGGVCAAGGVMVLFGDGYDKAGSMSYFLATGALFTLGAWALAFVLAGSFWRPPR